jgi:hypothetical protein
MGCPPSGCRRLRRWLTELWPGVLVQRRRVHEIHIYPASPQLEGRSVPVFDQERHTEQRQWVALTGCQGNRIELSKPKHTRDPLLAVPPEVAQAAQRPLQIARSRLELTFVSGTGLQYCLDVTFDLLAQETHLLSIYGELCRCGGAIFPTNAQGLRG